MEMNRRRSRRFMISSLMPFSKSVKPPTSSQDLYNNVYYNWSTKTSYAPHPDFNNYLTSTTLSPKLSFLLQPPVAPEDKVMEKKLNKMAEKLIGRGINGVDESVDARASSYISSVRERFKLEHCERVTTVISLDDDDDVDH